MNLIFDQTYTDLESALPAIRAALRAAWPSTHSSEGNSSDAASSLPEADASPEQPPRRTRHYVQLVVHEWVANLTRHATFADPPRISVRVLLNQDAAQCEITDNSRGFDLNSVLSTMGAHAAPFPESGMGLRIIDACTNDVSYRRASALHHRFTASVPYDHNPWMNVLF
jgi:serine/threonine-protein kinase RsbW